MTVEIEFRASVNQAVAGIKAVNQGLETTVKDASNTAVALKQTSQSVVTLTVRLNELSRAQEKSSTTAEAANASKLSAKNVMGSVATVSALLATEIALISKAFDLARDSAEKFGDLDTVQKIDAMTTTFEGLQSVLTRVPIGGRDFLEWMGRAAEGAKGLLQIVSFLGVSLLTYAGALDTVTAVQIIGNIADAERIATLERLKQQITTVADATDLLRAANRKQFDEYQSQKQSGYIDYAINQAAAKGITAPTRDIGGRGSPGQAVVIGRGAQPEVFIPDQPGTFYPNAGVASGGGNSSGPVIINVALQAGAFLGDRGDALKLANELAPLIARAMGRGGSVPNGSSTRS